jgi:hypothetical protein
MLKGPFKFRSPTFPELPHSSLHSSNTTSAIIETKTSVIIETKTSVIIDRAGSGRVAIASEAENTKLTGAWTPPAVASETHWSVGFAKYATIRIGSAADRFLI